MLDDNKTEIFVNEADDEVITLFVCSHENGLESAMKPAVYYIDSRTARKRPIVIGRGTKESGVDIVIPVESGAGSHISRVQGQIGFLQGRWFYKQLSENSITTIKKHEGISKIDDIAALSNFEILQMGFNDEEDTCCCTIVFVGYKTGNKVLTVPLEKEIMIGRSYEQCKIVLPIPFVSETHAKIAKKKDEFFLTDLKSSNGTWCNGAWVKGSVKLDKADAFSICDTLFVRIGINLFYTDPDSIERSTEDVMLRVDIKEKAVENKKTKQKKTLLRDIKGIRIKRGELVAIIGGSGAGKSTLMNCINGMDIDFDGTVVLDGSDIKASFNESKRKYMVGCVPQETIIHSYLSVEEELKQAAKIRRNAGSSDQEIENIVNRVIKEDIRLKGADDGKKLCSALSGGEKRRVSIGVELVAERALLCLDEPDAGLDPLSKKLLFQMLKRLANGENGRSKTTILVIIHDVSFMDEFDQVVILGKKNNEGRLVFAGSPKEGCKYFNTNDYISIYDEIENNIGNYVKN